MQADDARREFRLGRQFRDRERGGICGENRMSAVFVARSRENFFFDFEFFRGGFDHDLHVAHRHRRGGSNDAGPAFLRFFVAHQSALHRVGVGLVDIGEAAIDRRGIDIAQNNRDAARAEPLRDTGTHHARADNCGMHNFLGRTL